jgi:acetyl-CoA synthetase
MLTKGYEASRELEHELSLYMVDHLGAIARPEVVKCVESLPKTRSGKIMRRILKARIQGLPEGDLSTLEE